MSLKSEIIRIALVGTQRSKLSQEHKEKLKQLGVNTEQKEESTILSSIALLSLAEKASYQAKNISLDDITPLNVEHERVCSLASTQHLKLIIEGSYKDLLPEFLQELAKQQKNLPAQILPELLYHSLSSPTLWKQLEPNIGERGRWLITQNPDWQQLLPQTITQSWEDASNEQRVILLQKEKINNPQQAITWLKETWVTEGLRQQLKFLEAMTGIDTPEWESFLEECLGGRHKGIRKAAVQLLAQMPQSSFSQRMKKRVESLITYKKSLLGKGKMNIVLPEEIGDSWIRDGIDPSVQWFKGGIKASRLGQVVALIHPGFWKDYFEMKEEAILSMFMESDYSLLLFQALLEAANLHQDKKWAETLLLQLSELQGIDKWKNIRFTAFQEWLPETTFNTIALKTLRANPVSMADENTPIVKLLKGNNKPWSDALTLEVTKALQKGMEEKNSRWNAWHYKAILNKAACLCNADLYADLNAKWQFVLRENTGWDSEIEEFLATLYFRTKMVKALQAE